MQKFSDIIPVLKTLPEPDKNAKQISLHLAEIIKNRCEQQGGSIPFSEYMQLALYEAGLGYYASGRQKFGVDGDFITAPEISPLFSQCLARQCAQILNAIKHSGKQAELLEFGAGSGVMAADVLLELEACGSLPEHYYILELSSELKYRQQQTIKSKAPHLFDCVVWLDALPEKPFCGVVLANEVLDAMPVECFRIVGDNVELMQVAFTNDELELRYNIADETNINIVRTMEERREQKFPDAYCSEFNATLVPWMQSLFDMLEQGIALLIDYGYPVKEYYHDERNMGTLICHYQHRAHTDVLWYPGLQDITTFVDFSAVAYAAVDAGFDVNGYTTQADFLMASGLVDLHKINDNGDSRQQLLLSQQIKTLTLPSEMGERFKVMALAKNFHEDLMGFSFQDYRNRL